MKRQMTDCSDVEKKFRYYYQCIRLYTILCFGRNRSSIDWFLEHAETLGLKYDVLLTIVATSHGGPSLYRAAVLQLLLALYVDREPNKASEPVQFIRVWGEVLDKDKAALTSVQTDPFLSYEHLRPTPGFVDLKAAIQSHLVAPKGSMLLEACDVNRFTTVTAEAALMLLKFGFYDAVDLAGEISDLLDPLLALLNTANDSTISNQGADRRFSANEDAMAMVQAKLAMTDVCRFIFDYRLEKRLEIVFSGIITSI